MLRALSFIYLLLAAGPLVAQQLPKDIKRSVDTFSGDTVWETKYGRLDDPHGCGRSNLAIVWKLIRGPTSTTPTEWLTFQYIDVEGPIHSSGWLGAVKGGLNIDGKIIELQQQPLSSHIGSETFGTGKTETGAFLLPTGTLRAVADAAAPKIRLIGTERTCDGTVEENMKTRLKSLLTAVQ
jgi:hypothetical protein